MTLLFNMRKEKTVNHLLISNNAFSNKIYRTQNIVFKFLKNCFTHITFTTTPAVTED